MDSTQKIISDIFTDPSSPGGFSGLAQLYSEAKKRDARITRKQVREFLESSLTYTRNKPRAVRFKRLKTEPSGFMSDVQCDLGDMQKLVKKGNRGNRYLLVGIDVLSRRVFLAPTKSKTAKDMKVAFSQLFEQMPMLPMRIFTDKGGEFRSAEMHKFFADLDIQIHHSTFSSIKAGVAERAIRNVKQRLYRYFGEYRTLKWVDVIGDIANAINNSRNRVTGVRPNDVTFKNAQQIWEKVYGKARRDAAAARQPAYKDGDYVRVAKGKWVFDKGYLPTYGDELYEIDAVKKRKGGRLPETYTLRDADDDKIKGRFYREELSRVRGIEGGDMMIERVLSARTLANGSKQLHVKLYKNPSPVWVNESDIKKAR